MSSILLNFSINIYWHLRFQ